MAIEQFIVEHWAQFKQLLDNYLTTDATDRKNYLFRGQPKSTWRLTPTLDRIQTFESIGAREARQRELVAAWVKEGQPPGPRPSQEDYTTHWEVVARHHGLPTRLLDWTESPYIAAYFAYDTVPSPPPDYVTIWALDRDRFLELDGDDADLVQIVDVDWSLADRARAQRSVFTRLLGTAQHIDELIPSSLRRIDIRAAARNAALNELDQMTINAATMFPGLDGAAALVQRRMYGDA
ncbi:MAG: FRG domain-containing protein [Planctomycetota bacterium]